jgi:DNA-binding NtrC family response regulator
MRFSKGAMKLLLSYAWPGNVRELENTIERAAILAETDVVHSHDLPDKLRTNALPPGTEFDNGNMTLEDLEREHIKRVLGKVEGNKDRAAQMLGIHVSTLYRKMQRYRLDGPAAFVGAPPQARSA